MANDGSVIIDIEGDSSKFKSALSGLGSIASTALKGVTTAVAAVTTAVAGVATAAVKVGSGFESSMSQVAATMGLTVEDIRNGSEEFELLSQAAKDAGATTAFSASEAADALNYLALAGYDAATSADVLPSVLNLAAAGWTSGFWGCREPVPAKVLGSPGRNGRSFPGIYPYSASFWRWWGPECWASWAGRWWGGAFCWSPRLPVRVLFPWQFPC